MRRGTTSPRRISAGRGRSGSLLPPPALREGRHRSLARPGSTPQYPVERRMGRQAVIVLYVLALVAVVVGVDILFFRNRFWERLIVNVGIVLVFGAFYLRFLKHP